MLETVPVWWKSRKDWAWLLLLAVLPNLLSMVNINLAGGLANGGLKIHFFQLSIFLAAWRFGVVGGAVSGLMGSCYSALMLANPYIVLGNVILGAVVGWLMSRGWKLPLAVLPAFILQALWLWPSDVFLAKMPVPVVNRVLVSLLLTDLLWAFVLQLGMLLWRSTRKGGDAFKQ